MKKLMSVILIMTMCLSLLSVNVFAKTEVSDNVVFEQDFTNAQSSDYSQASAGYAGLGETNGDKHLRISANTSASQTKTAQAGGKVFIDNSKMEVGKTYAIYADIKFTPQSSDAATVTSRNVNMKPLNGTGSTVLSTRTISVPAGETVTLATATFEYTEALKTATVNLRVDFLGYRTSDTDKDVVTVDNVKVIEIIGVSVFSKLRNVTFDDFEEGYSFDAFDFDKNKGNTPQIVSSPSYSGNSLKITPTANDNRHTLKGFFDKSDVGKTFKFTMKVYPTSVSAKGIRIGSKPYIPSSNSGWNNDYFFTVGEEGSSCDMIVNTWNTITFTAQIGEYTENGVTYVDDSIAFVQTGSSTLIDEFYVDDIVISEVIARTDSYFKGMVEDSAVTKSFEEEDLELLKGVDVKDGSTGYGAIGITSETARTGSKCLKISGRTNLSGRFKLLDALNGAKTGDMYKISAYVKVAGANSEDARVSMAAMSNENYTEMYFAHVTASTSEWKKVSLIYIVDTDSKGNIMDEIAFAQEGLGEGAQAVDTIYVDDITVEPVTEDTVAAVEVVVEDNISSPCVAVKYTVDAATFDGVDAPFMFIVVTNTDGEIVKVDIAQYDADKTEYIYYVKGIKNGTTIGSVKLFKWNASNLYPLSDVTVLK
ncbi:MAG: hypothetical protein E7391_05080 [Ruminococcaceae bacterium]|nr:hypothetical protein [Oscillospiraceae bacterium]